MTTDIKPMTGVITERWQNASEREQQARKATPIYGRANGREVPGREVHTLRRDKGGEIVGPFATRSKSGLATYGRGHGNMDTHRASAREW